MIAILGGAMVLSWLVVAFGNTARVGSALSVLLLGGGAFGIFADFSLCFNACDQLGNLTSPSCTCEVVR